MEEDYAIVFPAGGISSRFGGRVKQLIKVGPKGETLVEFSMNQALAAGFNKIIFIVGEKTKGPFKDFFGDNYRGIPVQYVEQTFNQRSRDRPWGTNDALCCVYPIIDCPFVFCNSDDIYGESSFKMLLDHLKREPLEIACIGHRIGTVLPEEGKVNRGVYKLDRNGYVDDLVETFEIEKSKLHEKDLTGESLVSMNIFAFRPETVHALNQVLRKFKEDYQGDRKVECLLPQEIGKMAQEEKIRMKCYPAKEQWFGVTNPEDEEIVKGQLKDYFG